MTAPPTFAEIMLRGGPRAPLKRGNVATFTSRPKKAKRKSLWQQATGMIQGLPAGLANLGYAVGKSAVYDIPVLVGKTAVDTAKGDPGKALARLGDTVTLGAFTEGAGEFEKSLPLASMLATSATTTASNLRHPTRYARAARGQEGYGDLLPMLVEDIGNVAIVGAAVGKGLGAAASRTAAAGNPVRAAKIATIARATQRASRLGGKIGDAPILPYRGANRLLGKLVGDGESLIRQAGRQVRLRVVDPRVQGTKLAKKYPMVVHATKRAVVPATEAENRVASIAGRRAVNTLLRGEEGLTPEQRAASIMDYTREAEILADTAAGAQLGGATGLTPDLLSIMGQRFAKEGYAPPSGAVDLALAPDDAVKAGSREVAAAVEQYVTQAERGLGGRPSSPENLAAQALPFASEFRRWAVDEVGIPAKDIPPGATWDEVQGAVVDALGDDALPLIDDWIRTDPKLADPTVWPAPWRHTMVDVQRAARNVEAVDKSAAAASAMLGGGYKPLGWKAEMIPDRPYTMAPAVTPRYMPASELAEGSRARIGRHLEQTDTSTTGLQTLAHTMELSGTGPRAYDFRPLAGVLDSRLKAIGNNAKYRAAVGAVGRHTTALLDDTERATLMAQARETAVAQVGQFATGSETARDLDFRTREAYGDLLIRTMEGDQYRKGGLEPAPKPSNDGTLDFGRTLRGADVDDTTIWLPSGLRGQLHTWTVPDTLPSLLAAIQRVSGSWKGWILPFRLSWHIGDASSNAMMSLLVGDMGPREMVSQWRRGRQLARTPEGARMLDAVENARGLLFPEAEYLWGKDKALAEHGLSGAADPKTTGLLGPVNRVRGGLFKFNETMNRGFRNAMVLSKIDDALAKRGLSLDDPAVIDRLSRDQNVVRIGETDTLYPMLVDALDEANYVLGDMVNMPAWQRKYMRTVYPFWPWMRHVALLSGRLAIDHPMRVLTMMRIGELVATEDEVPPWLPGGVKVAGGILSTGFMNPLADTENLPGNPFGPDPERAILNPTAPAIKWAAAGLFGSNLSKGGAPLTRRGGSQDRDTKGLLFSPGRWDELAYQVLKSYPQGRFALDVLGPGTAPGGVGTGPILRYDSGEPIRTRRGDEISRDEPGWQPFASLFGIPYTSAQRVDAWRAQQAEKDRIDARRRRRNARTSSLIPP